MNGRGLPPGKHERDIDAAQSDVAAQLRLSIAIASQQWDRALTPQEFADEIALRRLVPEVQVLVHPEHGDYPALYELAGALIARLEWTLAEVEWQRRPWWRRMLGVRKAPRPRV